MMSEGEGADNVLVPKSPKPERALRQQITLVAKGGGTVVPKSPKPERALRPREVIQKGLHVSIGPKVTKARKGIKTDGSVDLTNADVQAVPKSPKPERALRQSLTRRRRGPVFFGPKVTKARKGIKTYQPVHSQICEYGVTVPKSPKPERALRPFRASRCR